MPFAAAVGRAALLPAVLLSVSLQAQSGSPPQEPQRPVFRTGANLVRVDAYPSKEGKIIEGLTAGDFDLLEDGVPQKIDSFQFVRYEQHTPSDERRDPNSQRDGFQLAADPSYRVFVLYLDNLHVQVAGSHAVRRPLVTFLTRVLGRNDLFGVLTTRHGIGELMLGQKTEFIEEQLAKYWDWGQGGRVPEDEEDLFISLCLGGAPEMRGEVDDLVRRRRLDTVFTGLEGLITGLAGIREERKNILLISDGWELPTRRPRPAGARPMMPRTGVTDAGKLTMGRLRAGDVDPRVCEDLLQRLLDVDFRQRLSDLLRLARTSNVTFYAIRPSGLSVEPDHEQVDSLRALTDNTDGIAVVNTNDLTKGAIRIGDDLSASYILGYYPTNNKADGRVRRITVRLKGSKDAVRARREYRAPTEEEMASMRAATAPKATPPPAAPAEEALAELKRLRPGAVLHTRGTVIGDELVLTTEITAPEIEAGRWKGGGDVQVMISGTSGEVITTARGRIEPGARGAVLRIPLEKAPGPFEAGIRVRNSTDGDAQDGVSVARRTSLFGDPMIFRLLTPTTPRPAGSVHFRRTERIRVQWPVAAALDHREGRLLGRDGVPLPLPLALSEREDAATRYLVADLNLAPLTAGEYVIDVQGTAAGRTGTGMLAIRVAR
jgi:VWFA-related protein